MEVSAILALAKEIYGLYEKRQAKIDQAAGDYIDRNLVQGLRLKKWDAYQ
jgi:hypothetical protein